MDIHLIEPTGTEIYYSNPSSSYGGVLDVDAQALLQCESGMEPVESIFYPTTEPAPEGDYKVKVKMYQNYPAYTTESEILTPFTLNIAFGDEQHFVYGVSSFVGQE